MNKIAFLSFISELEKIASKEKNAGIKSALNFGIKALKGTLSKLDEAAIHVYIKANQNTKKAKLLKFLLTEITNPHNVSDISTAIGNIGRHLGS